MTKIYMDLDLETDLKIEEYKRIKRTSNISYKKQDAILEILNLGFTYLRILKENEDTGGIRWTRKNIKMRRKH